MCRLGRAYLDVVPCSDKSCRGIETGDSSAYDADVERDVGGRWFEEVGRKYLEVCFVLACHVVYI
jgi:hypothetical protein